MCWWVTNMLKWALVGVLALQVCVEAKACEEGAFALHETGDFAEAVVCAERALTLDPDNPVWWGLLAEAQARLGRNREAASAFANAARFETDAAKRSYFLRAQALQLVYAGRHDEARIIVRAAKDDPSLETSNSLDWAMVAISAHDDQSAQDILDNKALYGQFTRQTALDAGYSAKRRGMDKRAVDFFQRGLAIDVQEEVPLGPVEREGIRRENRELRRDWSLIAQGSFSSADQPIGPANTPQGEEEAVQFGAEISRRIGGWRNGRPFSLFARVYHSEFLSDNIGTGNATQGWLGLRYKPFSKVNLNLETSRLIALDSEGLGDWSLRAAISGGQGLEREVGQKSWAYAHYYGDVSYLTDADVIFGLAEGRAGYSFLVDERTTVLTPYVVARLGVDSGRMEEEALGAGAGISLRHWFDETETVAHRSFIDFDVQGRRRLVGDRRASGVLATVTIGR